MKSRSASIGCLLCVIFWISDRLICLKDTEPVFKKDLLTSIIPQVIYTKTSKIKVTLALSDYPPSGTTVSADCAFTPLFNFTVDNSLDAAYDENSTFSIVSSLSGSSDSASASLPLSSSMEKDFSAAWQLETSTLIFTDATTSQQLVATRLELPSSHLIEMLRLQCSFSSDDEFSFLGFRNVQDAVAVLVADLSSTVLVNWALAPPSGSPLSDRAYPNPAYVEVAPCPCDLTVNFCDINCCCDNACSDLDQQGFACTGELTGGIQTSIIINGHCTYQLTNRNDWFLFLCLVKNNSPYLGMYYRDILPIVRNVKSMRLLTQQLTAEGLLPLEDKSDNGPMDSNIYQLGDPILTIVGEEEQTGYLTLPSRIFTGQCIEMSPLSFLVSKFSECNVRVSLETCVANSVLSATMYLTDSNASDVHVLARKDIHDMANVSVFYFCEGRANGECNLTRLTPLYNSSTDSCENVVHRVLYEFYWDGPVINQISVLITLWQSSPINFELTQHFQSRFVHSSQNASDSERDQNVTLIQMHYSGNPGYDVGKTLITGVPLDSSGGHASNYSDFQFMDVNHTMSIRLTSAGSGGNCDALGQPVLFGVNSYSGCRLDTLDAFADDCRLLRYTALRHLCDLMPSQFVSKGGAPQQSDLDDFIPIIREDMCDDPNSTLMSNTSQTVSEIGICTDIPSYFEVVVLYAVRGDLYGFPVYQIEGMRIRIANTTLVKCANMGNKVGGCWNPGTGNLTSHFITSSVEFVQTPTDLNPKTKRYWLIQDSLPCAQDTCFAEMAYPLTDARFGGTISYVTQCGLIIVALIPITLYLTKVYFW